MNKTNNPSLQVTVNAYYATIYATIFEDGHVS